MARVEYGRHKRVAVTADDSSSDVRPQRDWNGDAHDQVGFLGFDGAATTLASDAFVPTGTIHVITSESSTSDNLATITNTNSQENDWLILFSATGHAITVKHGTGNIVLLGAADKLLSATVASIYFRRSTNWYEFGGGTVGDGDITNTKLADMAANTVKVRDANSTGSASDKVIADTQLLIGDGTGFTAAALSGDVTMANTGATTIVANAVDGTHIAMGSDAQGDVLYYDGTNYVRLAPGTSGHFLKTQGASANPVWAALVIPAHTTQDWTVQGSAPSNPGSGVAVMYTKTIDSNNEGLFIKMKKNGGIVEVQVG